MIERPLDLLNQSKGKRVFMQLKKGEKITGTLLAFDLNVNVVLDNSEIDGEAIGLTFFRGDSIVFISPSKEEDE